MKLDDLKEFLDERAGRYNQRSFIEADPIRVPRMFNRKENIEVAAFLTSTISWGNRPAIIKSATALMQRMDYHPCDFILNASEEELLHLKSYVYRTFQGVDCIYFVRSLRNIYLNYGGLQEVMEQGFRTGGSVKEALQCFFNRFFEIPGERTRKHVAQVAHGASAKRLNMFLRWMVRNDSTGVDFGLWNGIPASELMLPLDLHTGNVARELGLLQRKQNNWKAVEEVTAKLRAMDPADPVKYDFALFGLGIFEKFADGAK
jgi:uncharacterized protein (TIGR02757 family)